METKLATLRGLFLGGTQTGDQKGRLFNLKISRASKVRVSLESSSFPNLFCFIRGLAGSKNE